MNSSLCLNSSPQAGEVSLFCSVLNENKASSLGFRSSFKVEIRHFHSASKRKFAKLSKRKFTHHSKQKSVQPLLITQSKNSLQAKTHHLHLAFKATKQKSAQCLPSFQSKIRSSLQAGEVSLFVPFKRKQS